MQKDGVLISDPQGKANIINPTVCLSIHHTTVFDLGPRQHNPIPKLNVTVARIEKQLSNLNP